MTNLDIGLEGVVVGETAISHVDGALGRLSYRGVDVAELARRPFLQVVWLLLFGQEPNQEQEQQLARYLMLHREMTGAERAMLEALPLDTHPMLMLQSLVPVLDLTVRGDLEVPFGAEAAREGLIITARLPTLVAAWARRISGQSFPVPSFRSDPLAAFLESFHDASPEPLAVSTLNRAQILQLEHSYNAGTFSGRVALGAQAPLQSSISASIGTLFGKLHGGADEAALKFAYDVGCPDKADQAVQDVLNARGRIMGIGHREYQVVDPRATLLKPMARDLCADNPDHARLFATLEAIEASCYRRLSKPGKELHANVEFYKGAVFHALGVPHQFFTAMFAMARSYGYLAHALEFKPVARLIRPRARYIGPEPAWASA
ncbi:MAG: citrate/2-methylcitrate synthase [Pseudomonadota bacterium]